MLQFNILGISSPSSSFICQYFLVMNIPLVTLPGSHNRAAYCVYFDCKKHQFLKTQALQTIPTVRREALLWTEFPGIPPTLEFLSFRFRWRTSAFKGVRNVTWHWLNYKWTTAGCWSPNTWAVNNQLLLKDPLIIQQKASSKYPVSVNHKKATKLLTNYRNLTTKSLHN